MNDNLTNYERARAQGKTWIRSQAEDKPLTFTSIALAVGFVIGAFLL